MTPRYRRRPRLRLGGDERGQVTAFVVGAFMALVVLAALVVDGGRALSAKVRALNVAEGAARAGAQATSDAARYGGGRAALDPVRARELAEAYLAQAGHAGGGTVAVAGDVVTVTVEVRQPLAMLGLVGVAEVAMSGTGEARGARGVVAEEEG